MTGPSRLETSASRFFWACKLQRHFSFFLSSALPLDFVLFDSPKAPRSENGGVYKGNLHTGDPRHLRPFCQVSLMSSKSWKEMTSAAHSLNHLVNRPLIFWRHRSSSTTSSSLTNSRGFQTAQGQVCKIPMTCLCQLATKHKILPWCVPPGNAKTLKVSKT